MTTTVQGLAEWLKFTYLRYQYRILPKNVWKKNFWPLVCIALFTILTFSSWRSWAFSGFMRIWFRVKRSQSSRKDLGTKKMLQNSKINGEKYEFSSNRSTIPMLSWTVGVRYTSWLILYKSTCRSTAFYVFFLLTRSQLRDSKIFCVSFVKKTAS